LAADFVQFQIRRSFAAAASAVVMIVANEASDGSFANDSQHAANCGLYQEGNYKHISVPL
jgi:predicted histidine transporter YuiF (NhaC family)